MDAVAPCAFLMVNSSADSRIRAEPTKALAEGSVDIFPRLAFARLARPLALQNLSSRRTRMETVLFLSKVLDAKRPHLSRL